MHTPSRPRRVTRRSFGTSRVPSWTRWRRVATSGLGLGLGLAVLAGPVGGSAPSASATAASGLTWSSLSPPTTPPALVGAVSAYDVTDSTIVLFGGRLADGQLSNQTWVWNGSTWSKPKLFGASPSARQLASMAFDTALSPSELILFGGQGADGTLLDDTWTWNGSSWNQVSTTAAPGGREGAAMTADASGQLLVFGGYGTTNGSDPPATTTTSPTTGPTTTTTARSTTTTLSPTTTTSSTTTTSTTTTTTTSTSTTTTLPAGSTSTDTATTSTTTSPDGPTGVDTSTTTAPSTGTDPPGTAPTTAARGARAGSDIPTTPTRAAAAAGSVTEAVGGTPAVLDDTWVLSQVNGADEWQQVATPVHPPPTTDASLVTGAAGQTLLFGGTRREPGDNQAAGATAQAWLWNGRSWSQPTLRVAPPARQDASLAYDPDVGGSVLFGGLGADGALGDTWLWTGSAWVRTRPGSAPPARSGAATAYDVDSRQLVTFGGADAADGALSSTEVLSPTAPTRVTTSTSTPSRATTPGTASHPTSPTTAGATSASTTDVVTPPPTTGGARPTPSIAALHRGSVVVLSGSGFLPHAKIMITFHSIPIAVGSSVANADGDFSADVTVPTRAAIGDHHFEATGMGPDGLTTLRTPVQVVALAVARHTSTTTKLTLVGIAAGIPLVSWAAFGIAGRRRRPATG